MRPVAESPKLDIKGGQLNKMDDRQQSDLINQKIKELNSLYHAAASQSGISDGELSVWFALLTSDKEYSQQDLCELLFFPKQTVNFIVSTLVKKGFVFLVHMPGTRNRKVIRLTKEGRDYVDKNIMWIMRAEQRAMETVDPQEIQATISMFEKYIVSFRKMLDAEYD